MQCSGRGCSAVGVDAVGVDAVQWAVYCTPLYRLYDKGHSVVGVEVVEDLVKSFFEDNELVHSVKNLGWGILYTVRVCL